MSLSHTMGESPGNEKVGAPLDYQHLERYRQVFPERFRDFPSSMSLWDMMQHTHRVCGSKPYPEFLKSAHAHLLKSWWLAIEAPVRQAMLDHLFDMEPSVMGWWLAWSKADWSKTTLPRLSSANLLDPHPLLDRLMAYWCSGVGGREAHAKTQVYLEALREFPGLYAGCMNAWWHALWELNGWEKGRVTITFEAALEQRCLPLWWWDEQGAMKTFLDYPSCKKMIERNHTFRKILMEVVSDPETWLNWPQEALNQVCALIWRQRVMSFPQTESEIQEQARNMMYANAWMEKLKDLDTLVQKASVHQETPAELYKALWMSVVKQEKLYQDYTAKEHAGKKDPHLEQRQRIIGGGLRKALPSNMKQEELDLFRILGPYHPKLPPPLSSLGQKSA